MLSCSILSGARRWTYEFEKDSHLVGCYVDGGHKAAINFLHGNGFCSKAYWPMLKNFSDNFNLLLQDAVGHGQSDVGSGFESWKASADHGHDVILREIGENKNTIGMGHSFGGILTMLMAAENPNLFSQLILLDPILIPEQILAMKTSMPNPMAEKTRQRQNYWPSQQAALEYFRSKSVYKNWTQDSLHSFIDHALKQTEDGGYCLQCPPDVEADIYQSNPQALWQIIGQIDVDVHIIYGEQSYPFMEQSCKKAQQLNKNISLETIPGSHCFMMEHPVESAQRVKDYIARK